MYMNTTFGDYPHSCPLQFSGTSYGTNGKSGILPGWMLLNYNKPVQVSSTLGGYHPNNAVDELAKTYWSAISANKGEWIQTDLGNISTVNASQINYADQDVQVPKDGYNILGKTLVYIINTNCIIQWMERNGMYLVDKSNNKTDVPHDYVELEKPVQARFIKLENIHMPAGKFAYERPACIWQWQRIKTRSRAGIHRS